MTDDAPIATPAPDAEREKVDPKVYAAFIGQIELRSIWLARAQVTNTAGPDTPESGALGIEERTRWEVVATGFRAFHDYRVRLGEGDETPAEIRAEFGVEFLSPEPMTEPLFAVFSRANLPVNTWPYLREFVSATMGRFGWEPFTLPALKRGTPRKPKPEAPTAEAEAKPKRTRRTAKKPE
jgi:hypothetical protein